MTGQLNNEVKDMPLHFGAITKDSQDSGLLAHLLTRELNHVDNSIVSEDGRIVHATTYMRDVDSGDRLGKFVFTMKKDDKKKLLGHKKKSLSILDVDMTLDSKEPVELKFLEKRNCSSDANEYYDVETVAEGRHLQIETVNRNAVKQKEIVDTALRVGASAFPFQLDVYDDMMALNIALGLHNIKNEQTGIIIEGLSETFTASGSLVKDDETAYSFLVGTVKSYREVLVSFGERALPFIIAQVETGLGLLPTAMSREVFDLSKLEPGSVVSMYAYIKADFALNQ